MSGIDWWAGKLGPRMGAVRSVGTWPGAKRKLHAPRHPGGKVDVHIQMNIEATENFGDALAGAGAAAAELEKAMLAFTQEMRSVWRRP